MIDVLVHAANLLFLSSYLVRDILWLRALTITATLSLFPYYIANGLTLPVAWNSVFIAINLVQIYLLLLQRRPCRLDARQQRLYHRVFRALKPREFLALVSVGQWREVNPGDRLIDAGEILDELYVIDEGALDVEIGARRVTTLAGGSFIGEMSFITGEPTSASVVASAPTQLLSWRRGDLDPFLARHPETRAALQLILGADMAAKLRAA